MKTLEQIQKDLNGVFLEIKSQANFGRPSEKKEFRPAIEKMQKALHQLWLYELDGMKKEPL